MVLAKFHLPYPFHCSVNDAKICTTFLPFHFHVSIAQCTVSTFFCILCRPLLSVCFLICRVLTRRHCIQPHSRCILPHHQVFVYIFVFVFVFTFACIFVFVFIYAFAFVFVFARVPIVHPTSNLCLGFTDKTKRI